MVRRDGRGEMGWCEGLREVRRGGICEDGFNTTQCRLNTSRN